MTHTPRITLAHGNGGRRMRQLIEEIIATAFNNPYLDTNTDAATLPINAIPPDHQLVMTSDSFTVQPLEFPGGSIGSLAIHGTINDLAVSGALPRYLTVNLIIEEGLELAQLQRIINDMASTACDNKVHIVAGDTKVVPRGEGSGLYIAVGGIGIKPKHIQFGMQSIKTGDAILVSGPIGDHGAAVLLARNTFGLSGELQSDAASILPLVQVLLPLDGLRFMRDPTRGGLATVAHEISHARGLGVTLFESTIPIRDPVRSFCEILGYDPLYLACEGRLVTVIASSQAQIALDQLHTAGATETAIIGTITNSKGRVTLETELGGQRLLPELDDEPLPRIC
ncbi:MAG: hydrogenase expression/formation protein HypE [Gammaproteobacteria bacterium]|nr:hydrogenase expression/formation protein HypE [Gammaproteobacteria bacterium]